MFWIIGADGAAKALGEMLSDKGAILSAAGDIIGGDPRGLLGANDLRAGPRHWGGVLREGR